MLLPASMASLPTERPNSSARRTFQVAAVSTEEQWKLPLVPNPRPPYCFRPAGPSVAPEAGRPTFFTAGTPWLPA